MSTNATYGGMSNTPLPVAALKNYGSSSHAKSSPFFEKFLALTLCSIAPYPLSAISLLACSKGSIAFRPMSLFTSWKKIPIVNPLRFACSSRKKSLAKSRRASMEWIWRSPLTSLPSLAKVKT